MSLSRSTHTAIRRLTYFAVAATLVLVGVAAPAQAAPDKKPAAALPAVGESFNLDASSEGIQFTVDGKARTSAPMRGTLAVAVEANPSDPKKLSVEAKPSDLRLTTKAAQTHAITIEQSDAVVDEKSLLRLVKPKPAKFEHVMALDLTFTVTMPTAAPTVTTEAEQTVQLETAEPVLLKSSLNSFPPQNAAYSLAEPVKLVPMESSDDGKEVLLSGFDVIVNQSA